MSYRLFVPTTFEDNDAVRVLEWHGAPGDRFAVDDLIVEVETHKALVEIRAGQPGTLRERCFAEGEWCPLGGVLALFGDTADEPVGDDGRPLDVEFRIG